jgi:hypothetical protein
LVLKQADILIRPEICEVRTPPDLIWHTWW